MEYSIKMGLGKQKRSRKNSNTLLSMVRKDGLPQGREDSDMQGSLLFI